jgi:TPR repeat protein
LIEAADQGWAPAQRMLAYFLRDGREGFPSDRTRARLYLEGAAANRYPPAEFDLAFFYLRSGDAEEKARARALVSDVLCDHDFTDLHQNARRLAQELGGAVACPA